MKKIIIIFSFISLNLFPVPFKLGVPETVFQLNQFYILSDLIIESFKAIKYEVEFIPLPNLRALDLCEKGEIDGIFPFSSSSIKGYKNLYFIDERIGGANIMAYTLLGSSKVNSWDDLKNKKIAYLLGSVFIENKLKTLTIDNNNLTQTKDYASLIKLLNSLRIDVAIMDKNAFETSKTKKTNITGKLLESNEVFLFLNKKYMKLKIPLEKEIKQYKKNHSGIF